MTIRSRVAVACTEGDAGALVVLFSPEPNGPMEIESELKGLSGAAALAVHPSQNAIYIADGVDGVLTVSLPTPHGAAKPAVLGRRPSEGAFPCALAVDPAARYVVTANYSSGDVVVHPIETDLTLGPAVGRRQVAGSGPVIERQERAHPHHVLMDPSHGSVLVTDLGSDLIREYHLSPDGNLDPVAEARAPAGSGPRHALLGRDGEVFVSDELSSTMSRYRRVDENRRLVWMDAIDTRKSSDGPVNYPAELAAAQPGGPVYVANRGRDTVAVIDISGHDMSLLQEASSGGSRPQHIAVVENHLLCALETSDIVTTLAIGSDGRLGPPTTVAQLYGPSWLAVLS